MFEENDDMNEEEDRELEAAEAVIESWEGILMAEIYAAEAVGKHDLIKQLEEALYAATRERRALSRQTAEVVRATKVIYAARIAEHRRKADDA